MVPHTAFYHHACCPDREAWGSGSPPETSPSLTRSPNFNPFLREWDRDCMDGRGRITCTLVYTCAYLHAQSPMPTCPQKLQPLCTLAWPTSYLHPLSCCDKIKNPWHLLCVKQDRHVNFHLLAGLTYLLFPLKLALAAQIFAIFLVTPSSFSEHHISEANSPLLRKCTTFSRFVKKLALVVL